MTSTIDPERIRTLGNGEPDPGARFVLYWMQASQRAEHNPALEFAVQRANETGCPLVVVMVVMPDDPDASVRHLTFAVGGMQRTVRALSRRGIRSCVRVGAPADIVAELAADAVELVVDRGYLRHQRAWYRELPRRVPLRITQVEGDVVVPIDLVSDEVEYAARTIRPKIERHLDRFLVDLHTTAIEDRTTPEGTTSDVDLDTMDGASSIAEWLVDLGVPSDPGPVDGFTPGTSAARSTLRRLLERLDTYHEDRNRFADPDSTSSLSPYLHFGQISPVAVATAVRRRGGEGADAFIDELVVRRELAMNFVARHPEYDSYSALPAWARESLDEHRDDEREHVYTAAELEAGRTHDEIWNEAMRRVREEGWIHNQLRMYWGKQIVRWTNTPEHAHRTLLRLNNRHFLDGRDPNSYANVGWCFGLHDQGFAERDVIGKLRPFTTAALDRKDDLDDWRDS